MNEQEWKDVNPQTADLPDKGRAVILCIVGGIVIAVLGFVGMKIRFVGLVVGMFAFLTGIGMIVRKHKTINQKMAFVIAAAGLLMLLTYPAIGVVRAIAAYLLITGAIGLVVLGLFKAVKLSWDLGKKF